MELRKIKKLVCETVKRLVTVIKLFLKPDLKVLLDTNYSKIQPNAYSHSLLEFTFFER